MDRFLRFSTRVRFRQQGELDRDAGRLPLRNEPAVSDGVDPIHILIIEDEEAHLLLMQRAIEKELPSASVHHLDNAAACLEELDRIHPDVIIADYLMPGMDGIEFLTILRQRDKHIPVIMITGQGDEGIAVRAMKLGARDYLVKSAGFFALIPSVIERVVGEERLRQCLRKGARLNELLLDSLPYPALLVNPDRMVLAVNGMAEAKGAQVGRLCWQGFGHRSQLRGQSRTGSSESGAKPPEKEGVCPFCMVDEVFRTKRVANSAEVTAFDHLWDMWWIPIDTGICLHYAIDITDRKRNEVALRDSREQLRLLSARLLEAQEEERKRISRELHDSIGSSLSAIKMCLESTFSQMRQGAPNLEAMETVISMTQETIEESRRIMTELRPSILDDIGIVATMEWLCRSFRTGHPEKEVEAQVDIEESRIPEPLKIVILRIAQEAFHNIAKYSRAKRVALSLAQRDGHLELTVRDDGIGFDPRSARSAKNLDGGVGLTSMKERTVFSGGSFRVESRRGEGTVVFASWPLSPEPSTGNNR